MDAIVTARVPVEVKEQVTAILHGIGSTPTKLINAAYAYVLRYHELPQTEPEIPTELTVHRLTAEQQREFDAWLDAVTLPTPEGGWDTRDYKEIIAEGRQADYEALG